MAATSISIAAPTPTRQRNSLDRGDAFSNPSSTMRGILRTTGIGGGPPEFLVFRSMDAPIAKCWFNADMIGPPASQLSPGDLVHLPGYTEDAPPAWTLIRERLNGQRS